MKVIFLDFDGVLNSDQYIRSCGNQGIALDPTRIELLRQIVDATHAEIVLSTSWREHWNSRPDLCDEVGNEINEIFARFDLQIYGATPLLHLDREEEIRRWLQEHPEVSRYVVLDDAWLSKDLLEGCFVKTSGFFGGLGAEEVAQAIEILNAPEYKKLFVISDVHGYCTLLKDALAKAGFDPKNPRHLLVGCGDYFDRGNENVEVLQFLERIDNKVLLRGNHEDMLLPLLQTGKVQPHNYINGTLQTLSDFFGKYAIDPADDTIDFSGKTRTVDRLCDFIEETVDYFETDNYLFVHGWVAEDKGSAASWLEARWKKWTEQYQGIPPIPGKTVVCGHMPTFGDIFHGNGLIAIDAGTDDTQRINVLVLEENDFNGYCGMTF